MPTPIPVFADFPKPLADGVAVLVGLVDADDAVLCEVVLVVTLLELGEELDGTKSWVLIVLSVKLKYMLLAIGSADCTT